MFYSLCLVLAYRDPLWPIVACYGSLSIITNHYGSLWLSLIHYG